MELFRRGCVLCGAGHDALCVGCSAALAPPPTTDVRGIGPVPALFSYEGGGARAVQALKFRDGRRLAGPLADGLTGLASPPPGAVVTWAPTTAARRRERGYDQSELLARSLARRLELPCRRLLRRRPGPAQTGRGRSERAANPAFVPIRRAIGLDVVVVDDVCTTGATLRAARAALHTGGAASVGALVVARTP